MIDLSISLTLHAPQVRILHACNGLRRHFEHVHCPPRPRGQDVRTIRQQTADRQTEMQSRIASVGLAQARPNYPWFLKFKFENLQREGAIESGRVISESALNLSLTVRHSMNLYVSVPGIPRLLILVS